MKKPNEIDCERRTWPLWGCLTPEAQRLLTGYQLRHFGTEIDEPDTEQGKVTLDCQMESLSEIADLMKIPSKYSKGFYFHG